MAVDPKNYNKNFNGLSRAEFLASSSVSGFYHKDSELGSHANYSSGNLRVSLLDTCNENCFFCYNEGMEIKHNNLDPDDLEVILGSIHPWINQIKLVGGEPLIHKQLDRIATIAQKYKPTSITTNGLLIDKWLDHLSKMESVTVSIHSMDNEDYNTIVQRKGALLNRVLGNISLLREKGYQNIKINTVLTKRTIDNIEDVIKFAANNGIPQVNLLSLLTMNESDRHNFVSPVNIEKQFVEQYQSEIVTTTRKRYFVSKDTVVDMVWQYCMVGCDVCRKDGFIRLLPDLKFSYCLAKGADVSVSDEVERQDFEGIRNKFEKAVSMMGKPVAYKNE